MFNQETKKPHKSLTYKAFTILKAVRTGLEPATSCVTGRHSNQLNYRTFTFYSKKHPSCETGTPSTRGNQLNYRTVF